MKKIIQKPTQILFLTSCFLVAGIGLINSQIFAANRLDAHQLFNPDAVVETAEGADDFTPSVLNIAEGDTILFINSGGGYHNLVFDSSVPGGLVPNGFEKTSPSVEEWSLSITFDEPGTYYFYCDPHFNQTTKTGMSGRIEVTEAMVATETPAPTESSDPNLTETPASETIPTKTPISGTIPTKTPDPSTIPTRTPDPTDPSESSRIYFPIIFKE